MAYHLPGYNFAGPGTDVEKQLKEGKYPVNYLDFASLLHDIDYGNSANSTAEADQEYIDRLQKSSDWDSTAVKYLFKSKQFVDEYLYDTDKLFRPDMPPISNRKRQHSYSKAEQDVNTDHTYAKEPKYARIENTGQFDSEHDENEHDTTQPSEGGVDKMAAPSGDTQTIWLLP